MCKSKLPFCSRRVSTLTLELSKRILILSKVKNDIISGYWGQWKLTFWRSLKKKKKKRLPLSGDYAKSNHPVTDSWLLVQDIKSAKEGKLKQVQSIHKVFQSYLRIIWLNFRSHFCLGWGGRCWGKRDWRDYYYDPLKARFHLNVLFCECFTCTLKDKTADATPLKHILY